MTKQNSLDIKYVISTWITPITLHVLQSGFQRSSSFHNIMREDIEPASIILYLPKIRSIKLLLL